MASAESALERLCSELHEVSAHYLIGRDGTLWQLVDEEARAWHAGAGEWGGSGDLNSRSIGIELDNSGIVPFSHPLMTTLSLLLSNIRSRWDVPDHGILAHSDFAPSRKADPGRRFDWRGLARAGHGVWPILADGKGSPTETAFLEAAGRFGYPVGEGAEAVLGALRQRFRPWTRGRLDATDMAIALDLAARFPVDPVIRQA
jgi:N-acetylmuramoyl-L-alanine amidase